MKEGLRDGSTVKAQLSTKTDDLRSIPSAKTIEREPASKSYPLPSLFGP